MHISRLEVALVDTLATHCGPLCTNRAIRASVRRARHRREEAHQHGAQRGHLHHRTIQEWKGVVEKILHVDQ